MNDTPKWLVPVIILIIVIVGGWFILKDGKSAGLGEGPIKIGAIISLTGDAAVYGEPGRNAIQLAVDEINAAGGIDGHLIELIVEDGKCDGAAAASAAQKLINVDQVEVIIGGFCSGESLAIVPIAQAAKVALISPGSSSPDLTGISEYFTRSYPSDASQGAILAEIAYNDKGWRKIAFFQEQTDYALGVYNAFSEKFVALGGEVTKEEFTTEQTDFRTLVTKVKDQNPDAVFLSTQTSASAGRILTQISEQAWKPNLLLTDITIGHPETMTAFKEVVEGALGAEVGVDVTNSKFAALLENYKAKYGMELAFQSYGQAEYDTPFLVRDAILAVGYDGTKIAQWLRTNVKNWEGASGSITINNDGDPVSGHKPKVVQDGVAVPYVK